MTSSTLRSTKWCYINKYLGSRLCGFREEDFFLFTLYNAISNMWPMGGTIFDPRGIIWSNLVEVHLVMLNTKYQGSLPCGFRHRVHGRGPLVDATYQISRQKALWFQRSFFHVFPIQVARVLFKAYIYLISVESWPCPCWHLGWGHYWPKGHNLNKLGRGLLGHATFQISRL